MEKENKIFDEHIKTIIGIVKIENISDEKKLEIIKKQLDEMKQKSYAIKSHMSYYDSVRKILDSGEVPQKIKNEIITKLATDFRYTLKVRPADRYIAETICIMNDYLKPESEEDKRKFVDLLKTFMETCNGYYQGMSETDIAKIFEDSIKFLAKPDFINTNPMNVVTNILYKYDEILGKRQKSVDVLETPEQYSLAQIRSILSENSRVDKMKAINLAIEQSRNMTEEEKAKVLGNRRKNIPVPVNKLMSTYSNCDYRDLFKYSPQYGDGKRKKAVNPNEKITVYAMPTKYDIKVPLEDGTLQEMRKLIIKVERGGEGYYLYEAYSVNSLRQFFEKYLGTEEFRKIFRRNTCVNGQIILDTIPRGLDIRMFPINNKKGLAPTKECRKGFEHSKTLDYGGKSSVKITQTGKYVINDRFETNVYNVDLTNLPIENLLYRPGKVATPATRINIYGDIDLDRNINGKYREVLMQVLGENEEQFKELFNTPYIGSVTEHVVISHDVFVRSLNKRRLHPIGKIPKKEEPQKQQYLKQLKVEPEEELPKKELPKELIAHDFDENGDIYTFSYDPRKPIEEQNPRTPMKIDDDIEK